MKSVLVALIVGTIASPLVGAGMADAQDQHAPGAVADYKAGQAAHVANVRSIQAQRDAHAANVAAYHGNARAAQALAHDANVRRIQANRAARNAAHDQNVAKIQRDRAY